MRAVVGATGLSTMGAGGPAGNVHTAPALLAVAILPTPGTAHPGDAAGPDGRTLWDGGAARLRRFPGGRLHGCGPIAGHLVHDAELREGHPPAPWAYASARVVGRTFSGNLAGYPLHRVAALGAQPSAPTPDWARSRRLSANRGPFAAVGTASGASRTSPDPTILASAAVILAVTRSPAC